MLKEFEEYKDYLLVVEGSKDKIALENLGFNHIFVLNESGKSLFEKIEQIEQLAGKRKVCILTDFDTKKIHKEFSRCSEIIDF